MNTRIFIKNLEQKYSALHEGIYFKCPVITDDGDEGFANLYPVHKNIPVRNFKRWEKVINANKNIIATGCYFIWKSGIMILDSDCIDIMNFKTIETDYNTAKASLDAGKNINNNFNELFTIGVNK